MRFHTLLSTLFRRSHLSSLVSTHSSTPAQLLVSASLPAIRTLEHLSLMLLGFAFGSRSSCSSDPVAPSRLSFPLRCPASLGHRYHRPRISAFSTVISSWLSTVSRPRALRGSHRSPSQQITTTLTNVRRFNARVKLFGLSSTNSSSLHRFGRSPYPPHILQGSRLSFAALPCSQHSLAFLLILSSSGAHSSHYHSS